MAEVLGTIRATPHAGVSATQDKYSRDADEVCATAASRTAHLAPNPSSNIIAIRAAMR